MINYSKIMKVYPLRTINRYNTKIRIKEESVAEHSFYVALFTLEIYNYLSERMKLHETKGKMLELALTHDIAESVIGDTPYDAKQRFPHLRMQLKQSEQDVMEKDFKWFEFETQNVLSMCVVKLADILSVLQYCRAEVNMGNAYFNTMLEDAEHRYYKQLDLIYDESGIKIELYENK